VAPLRVPSPIQIPIWMIWADMFKAKCLEPRSAFSCLELLLKTLQHSVSHFLGLFSCEMKTARISIL
jgi:hypothetical protein